ncbi:bifunctional folylpolyglutamate synthase/dihydrofolate synthase [Chryseobacterium carnipullorum]|uniref:Dihydrofolate synthase/folylpolyglutamate synthase n=2 Tax=Chryseobacterium carnipullorum TaxID=1124835 RepID=A0A3G6M3I8_CHRCU|nr:folylpolyglutamate synthase/dihydrofolate synthase family protein [Chryseobacterium carnipullorum]MDN5394985.1 bifunctional folylpolyglutamate synthase/dihydrofolate synthase [Chryseobacterium sp.]AZA47823.1 bifunctional folylpolyglutamate synthase/dihydrofolate synthase [Chryseobacterium carnipullorum]AZA67147.1 bifunctional folylpolyglutamate synthase/dihydrofolate synthase [Chryseobacterium carnipullorum]MDN5476096.1 bifunctional folylpolyglutamate synthase/dihydrofolate synthase [Chryseo
MTNGQYQEAVDWLFVQAPNYQIDGLKAYKPGLENITKLCDFFGNPQEKIKCIHIGGTNGKGSSSNMLASVLQDAGYKVGLYNSPHLIDFTERIKINGKNCDKEFVYHFIQKLQTLPEDILPSFFEFTTIMAFEYFYQQKVDFAIIEVGLGGRLDSTNIIKPLVAAITNVQLDHQNILGDTIEEIASEKAGIIKPHIPIISGEETDLVKNIIRQKAENENAPFIDATTIQTDLISDLKGNYQKKNIRVVLGLIDELKKLNIPVSDKNIENGLLNVYQSTGFIGRWFEFSKDPLTICDTGHNQAGLEYVFSQLNSIDRHKHVILGFVNDKKIDEVMALLPENSEFYFAKPSINRGRHPEDYENLLQEAKIFYKIFDSVQEAYLSAKQQCTNEEMIFIGGSNFVVGEFLEKNLEISE